jgi:protein-tyrosine phosphatase
VVQLIDTHCHILPGVDDGAQSIEDSIAMAREAIANGIRTVIATPHHLNGIYTNHKEEVFRKVDEFQLELEKHNIPLVILPGQEVHIYSELVNDLRNNRLITHHNKYMLLELPRNDVPEFTTQMIYEILLQGIVPIIPHPERNEKLREHPNLLYQMVKKGAISQITAGSIIGKFGKRVQKFSFQCIESNLCHLVSSDAHRSSGKRSFYLNEAYTLIAKQFSINKAEQLKRNAKIITEGFDIVMDTPCKIENKNSLYSFFRNLAHK